MSEIDNISKCNSIILCVAQDAGGAKGLIPIIQEFKKKDINLHVFATKYAVGIFENENIQFENFTSNKEQTNKYIQKAIASLSPDIIISGTCFGDGLEKRILYLARQLNIPIIAFVDHWSNYSERFTLETPLDILPNQIWVIDAYAKEEMIKAGAPADSIVITGHPYLERLKENPNILNINLDKIKQRMNILDDSMVITFISESHSKDGACEILGYDEYNVLDNVAKVLSELSINRRIFLIDRLHPKEELSDKQKHQELLDKYNIPYYIDQSLSPYDSILVSDLVIGMSSMLLIESFFLGKKGVSIQPIDPKDDKFIGNMYEYCCPFYKFKDLKMYILAKITSNE